MKIVIVLALLLGSSWGADDFKIKDIGMEKEHRFPYFVAKDRSKEWVADSINIYLHLSYLELLPNTYKRDPFEVINTDKVMPRLMVYSFEVYQNSKFISVDMMMEGCGAYCEEFSVHNTFLAQNGKFVSSKSLFSKRGLQQFDNLNHQNIQKTIKEFLKKDEVDREQTELYQECLKRDYKGKVDSDTEFSIYKNRLFIYSGRCSNHAMRALDDIGDFSNSYSFDEIKDYLSPIGKYLLDRDQKILKSIDMIEGVYRGEIAHKYPIKLFIQSIYDDGSLSAFYWYEKYKKPLDLKGTYQHGEIKLYLKEHSEQEKRWIKVESFIGRLKDGKIKGVWKNIRNGEEFDLSLGR